MSQLRGSRVVKNAREDAYVRALSENGDHVCVPWLGVDIEGRYVCPGFEYKPNRGLLAYVIPLVLQRELGLVPGFSGSPKFTLPPRDSKDPSTSTLQVEQQPISQLDRKVLESDYFLLLRRFLRIVKIAGPETERKFVPHPDDYYVIVNGPYERTLIGHLVTRPDGTGSRFAVPDGVDPRTVQQRTDASRIQAPPPGAEVGGATIASDTLKGPSPGTKGAALRAIAAGFRASGSVYGVYGIPKPGKVYEREVETEKLVVIAAGRSAKLPSTETIQRVLNQDPARLLADLST